MSKIMTDLALKLSANSAELTKGVEQANTSMRGLEKNTKNIGSQVMGAFVKMSAVIGSAAGAYKLFEKTVNSASGTADKFEEVMGGVAQASDKFFNIIANGDMSNLISDLKKAAQAGMDYAAALDQISERTLGAQLQKSVSSPEQAAREEIFRDKSGKFTGLEREKALEDYKAQAIIDAKILLDLANATAKAEEDKLRGLGIEASQLKELYLTYNTQLGVIDNVAAKLSEIEDLNKKIKIASREASVQGASQIAVENLTKLTQRLAAVKNGMSEEELKYAELLNTNDATKQENIDAYITSLIKVNEATAAITDVNVSNLKIQTGITKEIKEQAADAKVLRDELQMAAEKASALKQFTSKNMFGETVANAPVQGKQASGFGSFLSNLPLATANPATAADNAARVETLNLIESQTIALENQQIVYNSLQSAIQGIGDAFNSMFEGTKGAMKGMVTAVLSGIKMIIDAYLAQAMAAMIAKESTKGLLGLVTASVGVGLLTALWKSKVPEFASGGLIYGDTLARVGEYAGARQNPEVIAPLDKLKSMLGGTVNEVVFRIEGTQLVGILNKQNKIAMA